MRESYLFLLEKNKINIKLIELISSEFLNYIYEKTALYKLINVRKNKTIHVHSTMFFPLIGN